jgi:bacterioferritin-associated ferredoxin
MILCHCKSVNDRQVHAAIANGAADRSMLAELCNGASSRCGGCWPALEALLAERHSALGDRAA